MTPKADAPPAEQQYIAYLQGSLRLAGDGTWWHQGASFTNQKVANLFSRSVVWDEGRQRYILKIGKGCALFACEDTAYFVLQIDDRSSPWRIELSDGSSEPLHPETVCSGAENQIYCLVKGKHRARFSRGAHQILLQYTQDDRHLMLDGKLVTL